MGIRLLYVLWMLLKWLRSDWKKLVCYGTIGLFCAGVHFGLLRYIHEVLGAHYQVANFFGFAVAFVFNFWLNMRFTFGIVGKPTARESWRFTAKKGMFYVANAALLHVLVEEVGLLPWHAQAILIPSLGTLGFLFLKLLVFVRQPPAG